MPRTRGESIFFTAITAWMMVYVMTVYNTVLATGSFTNTTFLIALKGMWIEYIIIGLLAYFVSGHLSKMCAFRVVQPGDRPIFIIFAIQTFTVIWQVAFARCDRCLSRTWIYRQLYTGLSYDLLQKFYHGISAAAYFCIIACKTDLPDIIYQS